MRRCERGKTKGKETEKEKEMAVLKKMRKGCNEIQTEMRVRALGREQNLKLRNNEIILGLRMNL